MVVGSNQTLSTERTMKTFTQVTEEIAAAREANFFVGLAARDLFNRLVQEVGQWRLAQEAHEQSPDDAGYKLDFLAIQADFRITERALGVILFPYSEREEVTATSYLFSAALWEDSQSEGA